MKLRRYRPHPPNPPAPKGALWHLSPRQRKKVQKQQRRDEKAHGQMFIDDPLR